MNAYELIRKHRDVGHTDDPQFNKARKMHDWRNYVPDDVRAIWKEMSVEARIMVYLTCERQANLEKWD